MADLVVDTAALRETARALRVLAAEAEETARDGNHATARASSTGVLVAEQAVHAFLSAWAYGLRWIAAQAEGLADTLTTAAEIFDEVERRLVVSARTGTPMSCTPVDAGRPSAVRYPDPPGC